MFWEVQVEKIRKVECYLYYLRDSRLLKDDSQGSSLGDRMRLLTGSSLGVIVSTGGIRPISGSLLIYLKS